MARKRSVTYTALNIRVHPHPSPDIYVDLFNYLNENRRPIPLSNNIYLAINDLKPLNENKPLDGFIGEIIKYNGITDQWYNQKTGQKAEPEDLKEVNIPEHLKPNAKFFNFIFYPIDHKLVCEIKDTDGSISAKMLLEFFENLFKSPKLLEVFNTVEVNILPDLDAVDKILRLKYLKKLHLIILRPNADELAEMEAEIFEEMDSQNIGVYQKILEAQENESLDLNERTKEQTKVAATNGRVDYKAKDERTGLTVTKSTASTPLIERDKYDPDTTTPIEFLKQNAVKIIAKFRK
ncbi:DUF4747 family protein [Acinetobacter baumannii]|uniref:DUF4747 family protein n=1 Tax=Acinetobacter baumannii TaxID=470 RepID=UPI0004205B4A|nr:DUF4747 family protein [Acinetobacter baumannii]AYX85331.1 DUF4747 family protein [Acinetobacter baumannii]MBD0491622.1 DUF4747 family protein [Acinetobacter baumannii]MCT9416963.1 DUF4747 family protein [Acinetobacter baumannii]MCZ0665381.1 DUF4747 family protein [Acinetobacter baumannii]MCZ3104564.1 DUF4747 family protein [Acinetobacter baumannii]